MIARPIQPLPSAKPLHLHNAENISMTYFLQEIIKQQTVPLIGVCGWQK